MLVYMRPSNEALLRARVPGAQDQRGCPSNPFLSCAFREHGDRPSYPALFSRSLSAGGSNRPANEAAGESQPEAYPLGYVEDLFEVRTQLGVCFSSRIRRKPSWRTSPLSCTDP